MKITNNNAYIFFKMNKKRSTTTTKARIQPFCKANNNFLRFFCGIRVFPRMLTEKIIALHLHNNHFCRIWKSEGVSFNQTVKELKGNFEEADNYITEENVKSYFKYEFIPNRNESHLTNFIVYDLETHNRDRARPYCISIYRLSKLAGNYNRDLSPYEIKKCKKDTLVFDGDNCISKILSF